MREQRDREMATEERDLGDIVLSWSVPEIMNDDLHKGQRWRRMVRRARPAWRRPPSLSAAHEGNLARQYSALRISGREAEDKEMEDILARFASLRDREERLAAIAADLREMEAQRRAAGLAPSDAEVAAFVILRESADGTLEGLPTNFPSSSRSND
ncbi:hypothetical protein GQ55_7G269300 [Panicum hallii var. hallii]|uniref:Uncharacterized protein n=1 Tax=Panicum hallii var. hallii TaxID=1504633 RepID=A0A2T7CZG6_9POAL|nr:hypothetical protein GQ55_7G269300 [Panicum hallii var. hallii]